MALHSFNIKYRYNLIPLYNLTLVYYFYFIFYRYEFMIHFGFGTYTFPHLDILPRTLSHMTHAFHHAITATSFIKKIKLKSRQNRTRVSSR